jgi:hypothetical protein
MRVRLQILFIFIISCNILFSQELNKYGHIISKIKAEENYEINTKNDRGYINADGFELEGNSFYRLKNGYLTILTISDNMPSSIFIYDNSGKKIFSGRYSQVINFALSENKNYGIFYENKKVVVLDLINITQNIYEGSLTFAISEQGIPAFYSDEENLILYGNTKYEIAKQPNKLMFINNYLLAFAERSISLAENNSFKEIFKFNGKFFEAISINNKLYVVEKIIKKESFNFNLYESSDLTAFSIINTQTLNINYNEEPRYKIRSGSFHEPIKGPFYYDSASVHFNIGNSYGEIQTYGGAPYLHPGVDFLDIPNQEVFAVRQGFVKAVLTTGGDLYWRIAIANNATSAESVGYLYAHLDQASIPYTVGDTVYAGNHVGNIVTWPGFNFHHCHFARIKESGATWDGNWWTVSDPLQDVTNFIDTIPPVFENTYNNEKFAFRSPDSIYLSPAYLHDSVQVISKFYDIANSTWKIDVCSVRYSLSNAATPGIYIFDTLCYKYDFPIDQYFSGNYTTTVLNTIYSTDTSGLFCNSLGNYVDRDYYHIVSNSNGDDTINVQDQSRLFNTTLFPTGNYYLKITARDCKGNSAADSMMITINNSVDININDLNGFEVSCYPNPADDKIEISLSEKSKIEISNIEGRILKCTSTEESHKRIDISEFSKGMYFIKVQNKKGIKIIKFIKA